MNEFEQARLADSGVDYSFTRMDAVRARWTLPQVQHAPRQLQRVLDACFATHAVPLGTAGERARRMPESATYVVFLRGRRRGYDDARLVVGGAQASIHEIPAADCEFQCGFRLRPGAGRLVLGVAPEQIQGLVLTLREVWGSRADQLLDQLCSVDSVEQCWRILRQTIVESLQARPAGLTSSVRLAEVVRRRRDVRLSALARELGFSVRTLERRFTRDIGISPKHYQRIARMAEVLGAVARGSVDWANIAADSGFYDQSHLIEDCHRILGASPERFFRSVSCKEALDVGLIFERT